MRQVSRKTNKPAPESAENLSVNLLKIDIHVSASNQVYDNLALSMRQMPSLCSYGCSSDRWFDFLYQTLCTATFMMKGSKMPPQLSWKTSQRVSLYLDCVCFVIYFTACIHVLMFLLVLFSCGGIIRTNSTVPFLLYIHQQGFSVELFVSIAH